ncbi:TadE/TadG family type IV pilus assembly protein [Streptomyces sp. CA-251247]|uniref:TadE/TadG family type IV pilus assembly protein n=1 Tax=Streptomyces sp. CA-251247 TaxID=3240062 RepID=UPI003D9496F3
MRSPGTAIGAVVARWRGGRGAASVVARLRGDRGQAAIEFTGTVPVILATLVLLWQAALLGYTFSLAGNAADAAARAGAVDGDCSAAGTEDLPGAWQGGASVNCGESGDLVTATVVLDVPVLFPGSVNFPFRFDAHASAAREDRP